MGYLNSYLKQPPSLWTPVDIETYLWYDFSDLETLSLDNSKIIQARDKSGHDKHMNNDGQPLPLLKYNGINNLPSWENLNFDAVLKINDVYIDEISCYHVVSHLSGSVFDTNEPDYLCYNRRSNSNVITFPNSTANTVEMGQIPYDTNVVNAKFIHANPKLIVNGGLVSTPQASYVRKTTVIKLWFGRRQSFTSSYFRGKIGEVIFVKLDIDSTPGLQERIEGYLAHKWGLQSRLQSSHPFKEKPPMK